MLQHQRVSVSRNAREWRWWLAVFLLLGLLLAASLWYSHQETLQRERQRLAQQARTVHDNVALQLAAINRALSGILTQLPRWRSQGDEGMALNDRLQAFTEAMVGVNTMVLLDAQGRVIASDRRDLLGQDLSGRNYFPRVRQAADDQLLLSAPFEPLPGLWVVSLVRRVPGQDGGFGGALSAALDAETFRTLVRSVLYAPDMKAGLIGTNGVRFVAQSESEGIMRPGVDVLRLPDGLFARFQASGLEQQVLEGPRGPGSSALRMVAYQTINPQPLALDQPLVVAVVREVDAVLAPWRSKAWMQSALYLLALLLSGASLWRLQQRRRQFEAQSAALRQRWQAVLTATNQGVWDYDLRTGRIFYSSVWKKMLGYAEHEIGDSLDEWATRVHPDDWERAQQAWQDHLAGRSDFYECLHRIRCRDGHYQWILDRGRIIERDASGQPLRVVGTKTDVDERRQLQERLDHLAASLPGALYQFCMWPDGRSTFPYASPGVQAVYECSPEALQQSASAAFARIHPDRRRISPLDVPRAWNMGPVDTNVSSYLVITCPHF